MSNMIQTRGSFFAFNFIGISRKHGGISCCLVNSYVSNVTAAGGLSVVSADQNNACGNYAVNQ